MVKFYTCLCSAVSVSISKTINRVNGVPAKDRMLRRDASLYGKTDAWFRPSGTSCLLHALNNQDKLTKTETTIE